MSTSIPDVAVHDSPAIAAPLRWVGMDGIVVPVQLTIADGGQHVIGRARAQIDLPAMEVKGIHMSRLYRLLDTHAVEPLTPVGICGLLSAMVNSHADCASTAARVDWYFDWLRRVPALVSNDLSGWRGYPVWLRAEYSAGHVQFWLCVEVGYSSTCPCSAALARQMLADAFLQEHVEVSALSPETVADWLRSNGSYATPHSQRSLARIEVALTEQAVELGLPALVDCAERILSTPVQAAVRRVDEQAFARLNGANLMYVEDATRRLQHGLAIHYSAFRVHVRHLESLHPHDAVASTADE
ncbi:GTP cyclohydrolase FolE2 [Xylella fastidiosa]|uniref:GTP cyclohydrolase FolE2 n=4 Tax=Xylella fastidiosa TaxID=2371 RepID=GCH4_XYLFM|nr:GTP cyclohydrolase FolE2 [Xylella fastidiosa]B0U741.2 RecName: Full=GTP cyclohydrolase FolE2 [Xylella fastidiosa M12]EGO80993.1 Putative GTP cyclohydrolase [Xylella fastidiosa EB92.1]KAJ4851689.1 GTP cyclohydrolase FolE2 [Xylella fastidiosa subsp. multiplex]KAJ4852719.1 GTP cyclohydrolase FolE2 [Xylella fastidiosa subsp. multiplex]KAJ4852827.1 GTP cyclohydrolase FolE2 [Xylella fastidiosa subsp. multiplex]MBS9446232.1 GTP cyclohydrolase I FolE2 [Xylella fastidiosa subsp. multiplex]